MKSIILFIISLLAAINLHAQNPLFEWVKSNHGCQGNVETYYMEIDTNGNIYSIGLFSGTVDFDPSPSNASMLTASAGPSWYIQKLDKNGNFIWVRSIYNSQGRVNSFKVDDSGDLYIIGEFSDSIDLDPGYLVYNLVSQGGWDVFMLKLSTDGNFIWAKSFGGSNDNCGKSLCIDPQGNVYSHGSFKGTADFDPGPGTFFLNSQKGQSAFVQKLDHNGDFIWAKAFLLQDTLSGGCEGKSIDLDSDGNVYCAGWFQGPVDFDPGPGVNIPPSNAMGVYITKLDSLGNFLWLRYHTYVGSWGYGFLNSMVLDRYNNVYATGIVNGSVDFDPGPDTLLLPNIVFIQKLDKDGNFLWAKSYGYGDNPNSITTDTFGNIYTTGSFKDSTQLDPGPDSLVFYTYNYGAYLQKLNSKGELIWAGILQSNNGGSMGFDLYVDLKGNVFSTGKYGGTVDFRPDTGVYYQTPIFNSTSSYILKLSQCKVLTTEYVTACDSLTWMDGITYHQSTQSAYFTLPGSAGCDSIICLSLNIPVIDTTVSVSPNGVFGSNQNAASYQWLDCNNGYAALPGDTLQTFTPTVNGDYAVEINLYGCVDTSACMHIGNVSIEEIAGSTIRLYPNPNSGKFILDLGYIIATEIRILNSLGQEIIAIQDVNRPTFDFDLKPGIYFAQIRTEKANTTVKFVVR
jgi:hypothetical protein